MTNMSHRAYGWTMATLIAALALIMAMIEYSQQVKSALLYVLYGAAALAILAVIYVLYLMWHSIKMRAIDRQAKQDAIQRENDLIALERQAKQDAIQRENDLIALERERLALERERMRLEMARVIVPAGHAAIINDPHQGYLQFDAPVARPALRAPDNNTVDADSEPQIMIPRAPAFHDMTHLITPARMPLCFTIQDGVTAPAYGTVDDLLSMAVTGKPGRGKTTALMYYVCMLLKTGAEVWVYDPHGAMAELSTLNNQPLPGMPKTARIVYLDRREDIVNSVPLLHGELDTRDELYRPKHEVKHPLLLLADELPVLADYDVKTAQEYKLINKQRASDNALPLEVPLMIELIRRFVLEARKWRCFFIGSGQTFDAEILPTRVTESFNSRIVFFSSDRRARMSGLENDAVKELLPVIRNAGSGIMIFDCSRWDKPTIGAIPNVSVADMMSFLGVGTRRDEHLYLPAQHSVNGAEMSATLPDLPQKRIDTGDLENGVETLVDAVPGDPASVPARHITGLLGRDVKRFNNDQSRLFATQYRKTLRTTGHVDIKAILRDMRVGNRYYTHAGIIAEQIRNEVK